MRMTTGKKRLRVEKGSKARVEGSKAGEGSTHNNPYLFFFDAYLKKAKAANKSPRFIIAKYTKLAAEIWNNMSDAEKAPFVDMAKERKARIKKYIPKEKKKNAAVWFQLLLLFLI
ncbi:uncharacterized protein LOC131333577 [Rhododendron vialii]|uniref:uncharacterized protein LOC131333577 n=1 Tax=Rhododendron vialii TaxID=182163 RepID=UPI00265FE9AB|nr:uncharacterized protein LOC131333577 [Rhododendron vialii]